MMKIVVHDYAGHAFPISLSRALAERGHDVVHAFASSLQTPRGELTRRVDDPSGLQFREIRMNPDYPKHKYSFRRRRSMEIEYGKEVARFIDSWKPDAVLSGNTPTETQEPITRATTANNGRFYYWVQDFYSLAVDKILKKKIPVAGSLIGSWYRHLDRRQFSRSSRIIAITSDFTPILSNEFGVDADKVDVIPNWALIDEIPLLPKDNEWARRHQLHDQFVFLYSGTIGMKHNPAMLLELALRHRDSPDVKIVVVSEGIGAEWLKKEGEKAGLTNLKILPYQPFAELPAVLATGDVLIGILEKEAGTFSVPSKTLSYLCAGRPLLLALPLENLAARITATQRAGLMVEPDDIDGFLSAADHLLDSDHLRIELAGNARRYAEETFPIHKTAATFEQILSGNSK
ncbi:glycosyltransferase family 4 protein [Luteolibacter pohnpeiensis]|uniref:Glycosyltransferase family 4 protein n=1 Tax=Luteolibacter pohnpeiensis TaxID=454153 RepID=A0A934S715_9BACT|nr:glycosyltransferase family 4 protein [Luteolibacter pohnpeiensis]MBK1882374.1 glycosyltransferase family 4 protein [Luteolibacter pohnpeiensis]